MSETNFGPKPPARLHTAHVLFATLASIISIVGGVYSLKGNIFQEKPYGELTGYVRDERLARPLRLATVEVSDANEQIISTLSTDENGSYSLKRLREGNYRIKTTAPYHEDQTKNVIVQKNRTSNVDFNLAPIEEIGPPPAPTYRAYPPEPNVPRETYYEETAPSSYASMQESESAPDSYSTPYDREEGMNRRQPTSREMLVRTGAVLLQQMLEKKKSSN